MNGGFLHFFVIFVCGKLTKPSHHARPSCQKPCHHVSQNILASNFNKNRIFFTKRPPVATTVPSGTNTIIGIRAIGILGPGYTADL